MTVHLERTEGVAVLTLSRPERHNAFDQAMTDALAERIAELETDGARAVVITGSGRSFSSGADLAVLGALDAAGLCRFMFDATASFRRLARLPAPVVAAVAGYCLGGGFELALHCDAIVAADDAVFGFPETSLGLSTTSGSVARLVDAVGVLRAKEVLLFGRRVSGREAHAMGLAHDVVPPAALRSAAIDLAGRAAAAPLAAVAAMKELVARSTEARAAASFVAELETLTTLARRKREEER